MQLNLYLKENKNVVLFPIDKATRSYWVDTVEVIIKTRKTQEQTEEPFTPSEAIVAQFSI